MSECCNKIDSIRFLFTFLFLRFFALFFGVFFLYFFLFLFTVLGFFDKTFTGEERGQSYSVFAGILSGPTPDFIEAFVGVDFITASKHI